jgi:hypothetical protein
LIFNELRDDGSLRVPDIATIFALVPSVQGQQRSLYDDDGDMLLSAQIAMPGNRVRLGKPTPIVVRLIWRGHRILTGHLYYEVKMDGRNEPLQTLVSPELSLDKVPRELNIMLPELTADSLLKLDLSFIENETGDRFALFESYPLNSWVQSGPELAGTRWGWLPASVSLCVSTPRLDEADVLPLTKEERIWWHEFAAENFSVLSEATVAVSRDRYFKETKDIAEMKLPRSSPAYLPPAAMPRTAVALEAYHAVLLPDGVEFLKPRQKEALGHWLRGGGRAIIRVPEEEGVETAEWLHSLARKSHREKTLGVANS